MKIGYESKKNYRVCWRHGRSVKGLFKGQNVYNEDGQVIGKVGDNPNCVFDDNGWCIKGTV